MKSKIYESAAAALEGVAFDGMTLMSGGFGLSVALETTIAGLSQSEAEDLVEAAEKVCPYSNAVRGNINVAYTVKTR